MTVTVQADVIARDRASSVFNKVGGAATHNSGLLRKFGTTVAGVFTGAALYNGARDLVHFLGEAGKAAAEDEQGQRTLAVQLHNSAHATDAQVSAVERWITAQGKAVGIADDDLRPALARAVTATHDLGKAQDLVSEAEDVAAGKHKSLQTVIEALSKGYQGNVGGLSRLGVATKDAAGKTLDFDTINKNLADTFRGQAASAADTTAGKYQKLTVQVNELKEGLGYKLLPIAVEVGDWMLNKGLPAAEQLGTEIGDKLGPDVKRLTDWFKANKDELEDFAKNAGKDALNILSDLGGIVGKLVGWFSALPDPIKRGGGEAAIAVAAYSKLSSVMGGMKLTQFISNISLAETRTKALTSAAKTAGGAGGLLALYDGANRSNEALGALESVAGGAAAGFSMGGPWGALVGGAGGGLIAVLHDLSKKTDDISGSMYAGKRDVQDYASSLDEVTGAASTATAKLVLLDLQQHGLLSIGDKLGLSSRDLVGYVLGNAHAHDRVTAALKQANSVAGQVVTTFDQYGNVVQIGTQENRDLLQAAGQLTTGLGITRRGLTATERATRDAAMAGENMASVYKAFPKKVATEIDAVGIVPTAKGVADLAVKYDAVDNRHLKALIQATGTDLTVKQVQAVIAHMQYLQSHNSVTVTTHYVSVGSHGDAGTPDAHGGGQRGGQRMSEKASLYERLLRDSGGGPDGAKKRGELTHAGVALIESLVKGIDSGKHKLDNILSAVDKNLQNKVQHYNDVLAQYQAIQGGFAGVTSNIFSTTGADGGAATLSDILTASAGNVYSSQQLQQDVLKLLSEGLSKSLLLQLQQSGPSGLSDIHTLASQASVSQIQQLNANDVASSSALTAAGTAIANQLEGQDLKQAAKLEKIARALEEAVKKLDDVGGKFEFVLQGDTLVAVLAKHKKHHPDA